MIRFTTVAAALSAYVLVLLPFPIAVLAACPTAQAPFSFAPTQSAYARDPAQHWSET